MGLCRIHGGHMDERVAKFHTHMIQHYQVGHNKIQWLYQIFKDQNSKAGMIQCSPKHRSASVWFGWNHSRIKSQETGTSLSRSPTRAIQTLLEKSIWYNFNWVCMSSSFLLFFYGQMRMNFIYPLPMVLPHPIQTMHFRGFSVNPKIQCSTLLSRNSFFFNE